MTTCVDLAERFGDHFRITFDPAYSSRGKRNFDPWMITIEGRKGTIFPHGGEMLAVEVEGYHGTRQALERSGCCRRCLDGERFGTWLFHVDGFPIVARIVRPHRKRAWTDEQRREAAERLAINLRGGRESRETPPVSDAGLRSEGAA